MQHDVLLRRCGTPVASFRARNRGPGSAAQHEERCAAPGTRVVAPRVSRTRCNTTCCFADAGPRLLPFEQETGVPGLQLIMKSAALRPEHALWPRACPARDATRR